MLTCRAVGPQGRQELEAVELRHHDVGDDDVRRFAVRRRQSGRSVANRFDAASVRPSSRPTYVAHVRVIVGEEDARVTCVHRSPTTPPGSSATPTHPSASLT